ncbi:Crp/Fnr family transcriptional regulator [Aureibacter tunicatorum]|uniref:CRP-like cAMP-binding protein n=1 Tax=Aureibacter tunicatorum TaxID=866807 RepID=A0AAE3XM40_9BACT|nr:Crp/Fnr family transcriptional regulator [Aureibacter tunicatorum]MDR6238455.1 CRP-like cAMP-binding protein [Aureibacter tunicatorum]BDD05611.1 cyclic nucleotide-binding protein [Aureibacter tunicatorum]
MDNINAKALDILLKNGEKAIVNKNEMLLETNKICRHVYFINKGILRTFYYDQKGNNISHWFSSEGDSLTILSSLIKEEPSHYGIQALEDCEIIMLNKKILERIQSESPEFNRFLQDYLIDAAINIADRLVDIQIRSAKERYDKLLETHPDILQRVNLGHIASYLGITQQSLSRIRSQH